MNILVTGGYGLIGQAIVKKHISEGDTVYVWDNRSNPYVDYNNVQGIDLYSTHGNLYSAIKDYDFDIISIQASKVGVGESQYKPGEYLMNNLSCVTEIIQACVDLNKFPKKIMFAGSMGPYGEGEYLSKELEPWYPYNKYIRDNMEQELYFGKGLSLDETINKNPVSFYALSKMFQEQTLELFSKLYNVPVISLRYFSVYGNMQNPNNPYTGMLSIIANKILNSDVIELNEDGLQTRDLIHCDDIADIHNIICKNKTGCMFYSYNIGTGQSITLKELAEKMIDYTNCTKKLVFNNKVRKGDIKHSCANISKIKQMYNWEPKIKLEDSIKEYCNFIIQNKKSFTTEDTCKQADEELKKRGLL